jgi:steroid delta-isomerase-like uncharacterized protein
VNVADVGPGSGRRGILDAAEPAEVPEVRTGGAVTSLSDELRERREAVVREHLEAENRHDVRGVLDTFATPRYDVKPLGTVNDGEASVHELMTGLFAGFPDFHVEVESIRHSEDAVVVEEIMTGTHDGPWAGVPATGQRMEVPCACVFEFDGDRLTCERVYFDLATILRQLGALP